MVLRVAVLRRRWRQSTERVRKPRRQTTDTSRNGEALMPQFLFSTAMTANQAGLNPLAGWQYEYLPWPAQVLLLVRSTTTGTRVTIYSGSETIRERTPLQAGGTAGVTPSELNTPADSWVAAGGDRLKLVIDEVAGGTPTVDGIIIANPA